MQGLKECRAIMLIDVGINIEGTSGGAAAALSEPCYPYSTNSPGGFTARLNNVDLKGEIHMLRGNIEKDWHLYTRDAPISLRARVMESGWLEYAMDIHLENGETVTEHVTYSGKFIIHW